MAKGKRKFIEDAARVIDGRVAVLKAEFEEFDKRNGFEIAKACDRSAILEAEHCARLIRTLLMAPYHSDPYEVARRRWGKGKTHDDKETAA